MITVRAVHDALTLWTTSRRKCIWASPWPDRVPSPLACLRARRANNEVRINDLRFTAGEVAAFLKQVMKLVLPPEQVAAREE